MQAAQVLGGYSLGGADLLRRAMGKKKPEEMAKHRAIFRDGAAKKGIAAEVADEVFDLMEKFAGYGFNKSHAAAYSLLAYHTAWIKVHYPAEFFAANMTVELDDTDKLKVLLVDARSFGIDLDAARRQRRQLPLRAGRRTDACATASARSRAPGQGAIEAIVAARASRRAVHQPVRLLRPRRPQRINRRVVEALIKAGAFDALHAERSMLLASVGLALDWADTQAAHADQGGLFDFGRRDDHARRQHAGAGAGRRRAVEHQGAADAGEGGARLLPLGPPVRPERRRGAPLRQVRDRRPHRQPRAACCSPASSATCASSTASAAASRSSSSTTAARRSRRWPTRSCSTPTATC